MMHRSKQSVIVVGGGTMGLASALALAQRGYQVSVLERFEHVHTRGSHSGHTRVIRQAYHEGPHYVELVRRAWARWQVLEHGNRGSLLVPTGMLEFGHPGSPELAASIRACETFGIHHTCLTPAAARTRWPAFTIPERWEVCFSEAAGYLRVTACLDALRDAARAAGVTFEYGVRVRELVCGQASVRVLLESGAVRACDRAVVCAGAYTRNLCRGVFDELLSVRRRVLAWTRPATEHRAALAALPVWGAFTPEGFFYGFPHGDIGALGLKLACHVPRGAPDPDVDPEQPGREVHPQDLSPLETFLARYLPTGVGPFAATSVCMYTCTPNDDFLIDHHPNDPRIVVASGMSGHGFKFAPVIGELVAELVAGESGPVPVFSRAVQLGDMHDEHG
ncbi:MAG: N-methyl-L-tryptophan oxidase [Nannocystaceae bacterium]